MHTQLQIQPLLDLKNRHDFEGEEPPVYPNKNKKWAPLVRLTDDPLPSVETHRYGPMIETVGADRVTRHKEVNAIPQEELDSNTELDAIKAVALDLKNGVGTANERLQRVERVLFRLLKDQYGN